MLIPKTLKKGDKIAVVSLSSGMLGDPEFIHKYEIAKSRLENDFGLEVIPMTHALSGSEFIYNHPEARAADLMAAFEDDSIKGIICAIGGVDSIRILPYIDYEVISQNPKVFLGYSDSTVGHLIMNKAGLASYYGVTLIVEFGEYVKMFDYTKESFEKMILQEGKGWQIKSSPTWSKDFVPWGSENVHIQKELIPDTHGYEILQGKGVVKGEILGGCLDVFPMCIGTEIWPSKEGWEGKILFIETSENKISPELLSYYLRNLGAQGILEVIQGILVGKPQDEAYYEEYKEMYLKILKEFNREDLPVLYNLNVGHAYPTGVLPFGTMVEVDFNRGAIVLIKSATSSRIMQVLRATN